ncbi:ATP-binding protein [Candidatus Woesearchaeota archaeon]|nr:ATP-binding protein [Candidatus Woesearchaeota archaeon]
MVKKLSLERIMGYEGTRALEANTPSTSYPDELIKFVTDNFKKKNSNAQLAEDVRVASSELIANAIDYGNRKDPGKKLRLFCSWVKNRFYFAVQDQGEGFDIDNPLLQGFPPPEGGIGLMLARDRVSLLYNFKDNASYFCKKPKKA